MMVAEAVQSTDSSLSYYKINPNYASAQFRHAKEFPVVKNVDKNIDLVKETSGDIVTYHTINRTTSEGIHTTKIVKNGLPNLDILHEELRVSDRLGNTTLPKNYATDVVYDHFAESSLPMTSSESHSRLGHESFLRLANRAIDDNHHIYHFKDGSFRELTKCDLTPNIALGKTGASHLEHLILSKNTL